MLLGKIVPTAYNVTGTEFWPVILRGLVKVKGEEFRVRVRVRMKGEGLRLRDKDSGFRVQGSGFRVQGSGFRVQVSGFRVQGWYLHVPLTEHFTGFPIVAKGHRLRSQLQPG